MNPNQITHKNRSGITTSYQSEFMQNYVAESKVDVAKGIKAVNLGDEDVLIFYIDKAGSLIMLSSNSGVNGGWASARLSAPGYTATAFDVCFLKNANQLRVCYAQSLSGISELWVSEKMAIASGTIAQIASQLKFSPTKLPDPARTINYITCDGRGILYSSQLSGTDALYHYFIYGDAPDMYTLPENTHKVKQIEVGTVYGEPGVFILYDMPGSKRTMLFKSFPTEDSPEVTQERIEVKSGGTTVLIDSFDLIKDADGNDIIYLAGEGVYRAAAPDATKEVIATSNYRFTHINVSTNGTEETVWALRPQDQSLYYITNRYYAGGDTSKVQQRWTQPLPMYRGIFDYASIKGERFINQLFLFNNNGSNGKSGLVHLRQDDISNQWRENEVSVDDLNEILQINTFSFDLNFVNENGAQTAPIHITARQNYDLYINNVKYQLSPGTPLELAFADYYSIICPADSIAIPEIILKAPFLDQALVIDPTASMRDKMNEKIGNAEDLRNAKKQNGELLVPAGLSEKDMTDAAAAISRATATNVSTSPKTAVVAQQATHDTGNAIGDIFYSIQKGFQHITEVVMNVVNDAIQFVVAIGDKVLKWVAQTAADVMSFLEKVWEKIKVTFNDLVDFLAFLFDWSDIIQTKEAIKLTATKLLDVINPKIKVAEQLAIAKIREWKVYAERFLGVADALDMKQDINGLASDAGTLTEGKPDTRANWVGSKKELIFEGKSLQSESLDLAELKKISSGNTDPSIQRILNAIADLLKGTITIGEFMKKIAKILVDIAFEFIETMAREFFELAMALVDTLKEILTGSIKIPILSAIYKEISGADLSILDFISLLIAIPMTIGYKIAHNAAPFAQYSKEEFANRITMSLT